MQAAIQMHGITYDQESTTTEERPAIQMQFQATV